MRRDSAAASRVSATALIFRPPPLRHETLALQRFLRAGIPGLAIFGIFIDLPDIVKLFAGDDVRGGEHAGHHGMVLIVIFVHAVAPDEMQLGIEICKSRRIFWI